MLNVIKLLCHRIRHDKSYLITYLALIPIVVGIAIYFTNTVSVSMRIGVVGDVPTVTSENITYVPLETVPNDSALVLNRYDAVLVEKESAVEVLSTKGDTYNQTILALVTGQIQPEQMETATRGAATNIIGFLMMIVLLIGTQIYSFYYKERNGINKRILSTSLHCWQYMLSHFVVALGFIFIPLTLVVCGAIYLLDITIAMTMWQFVGILFLLCFFTAAFGLWLGSVSKSEESSLAYGNIFSIAGSIFAGGFVEVTNNTIFSAIVQWLPQKQLMNLLSAIENNTTIPYLSIVYILVVSILLILLGIYIEKKKLPTR